MGHSRGLSDKRRPYRGSSPLAMNGPVRQRALLLTLVGFLAIYTIVTHLSTRSVLSQCAELAAHDTSIAVLPPALNSSILSTKDLETETNMEHDHQELIPMDDLDVEESAEKVVEQVTQSPAITKVTMMYGPHAEDETMKLIIEGHKQHAARHGHGIRILDRQILHGLWSKHAWLMMIMLEEMKKPEDMRSKWLAWFDTDIIVMNPNVPLDIFLPPEDGFSHINLLCTNDHNGLNNGAFMIRVGEWGVRYFVDSLALHTYKPDVKLKYSEQSAMEYTITEPKYANKTMLVPQRWFNAYRGPRSDNGKLIRGQKVPPNTITPGDLQLHFAGKKTTKALMPLWVALAGNESSGWSVPLGKTKLPSEIARFWKVERERRDWEAPVAKPKKDSKKDSKTDSKTDSKKGAKEGSDTVDVKEEAHLAVRPVEDQKSSLNAPKPKGQSVLVDSDAAEEDSTTVAEAEDSDG